MELTLYQADAFTGTVFKGNPAAVCPLDAWIDEETMQHIALENNLSETAFFVRKEDLFEIRWFTPTMEIDLCGHATLAAGFVILNYLYPEMTKVNFFSPRSGNLKVSKNEDRFTLDFPATPGIKVDTPEILISALGKQPIETYKSMDYLVIFDSEEEILDISPDFSILRQLESRGVIISSKGNNADFVSRFFAPNAGVDEDPVTGSAHCTLTPYWSKRLNKIKLHAYQRSKRGGELFCEYQGDRVFISGKAVIYLKGTIYV